MTKVRRRIPRKLAASGTSGDSEPEDWHRGLPMMEDSSHRLGGDVLLMETAAPFFVQVAQIMEEVPGYTDVISDPIDFCQIKAGGDEARQLMRWGGKSTTCISKGD